MAGASRLFIALIVACSGVQFVGSPARGAEDESQILIGETAGAITGDVDGDGIRELVRVMVDPTNASRFVIEALGHDGDQWSSMGSAVVARQNEDQTARVPINRTADAFGLLAWNDGEREQVLLATVGNVADDGRGCCLTIVRVAMDNGILRVFPLSGLFGDAESVSALDLDDDGVDELLVVEPYGDVPKAQVRLLRWDGSNAFVSEFVGLPTEGQSGIYLSVIGETDGIPGDDVVFGPTDDGRLIRLAVAPDGALALDETPSGSNYIGSAGFSSDSSVAGGRMLSTTHLGGIEIVRWPRGGALEVMARHQSDVNFGFSMLGGDEDAVVIDAGLGMASDQQQADVFVYDLDLAPVLDVPASTAVARLVDMTSRQLPALRTTSHNLLPHVGPLPGGMGDGRPAFFTAGSLIILEATGALTVEPTNGLVSRHPVGVAGPEHGWMALASDWVGSRDVAFLYQTGIVTSITMTPIGNVVTDAPIDGTLSVDVRDAVLVEDSDGTQRWVAPDGGFTALIDAAPRSSVVVASGLSIIHEAEVGDGPLSVRVAPDREREGNQSFDAGVLVITPAGTALVAFLPAEILREPPELTTSARTDAFELRSRVLGRAAEGATITVDGQPVQVSSGGGFHVEVDAPIWPRDIVVVARDPLGTETVRRLEVVGFLDYRGLPWAPIVGFATVAFGIVLFIRIPRQRSVVMVADGDGRLEELDGD